MDDLGDFIENKLDFLKSFCQSLQWKFPPDSSDAAPPKTKASTPRKKHAVLDIFPESFDDTPGNDVINLTKEDLKTCLETNNANGASTGSQTIDLEKISLPITSSTDLLTTFNPAQRLAIYEFVSKSTKCSVPTLPLTEINLIFEKKEASDANQEKSVADLQTEERNSKRRRINYKQAKKVHTSGKTHTEVTAQVINNQMEMYEEWLQATSQNASTDEIRHRRSVEKKEEKGSSSTEFRKKHHKSERDRSKSPRREHGKKLKKHKRKDRSNSPERSKRSKKHKRSRE